jgi:hypothetical protein
VIKFNKILSGASKGINTEDEYKVTFKEIMTKIVKGCQSLNPKVQLSQFLKLTLKNFIAPEKEMYISMQREKTDHHKSDN